MSKYLASLIIPVYNVEKYLRKCLDSAVNQTLRDVEIIIVNDGSTDGCLSIIHEYALKDERIKVIDQKNMGLSAARNNGLGIAVGDYIAFMDSDDWMDTCFLEKMYETAESCNADIVICNHLYTFDKGGKVSLPSYNKTQELSSEDALRMLIKDSGIQSFAWGKLYSKHLFQAEDIGYPEGLFFEDVATTFKLFYYAKKVAFVNEPLYYYLQRRGSITKKIEPKKIFDYITAITLMRGFLEDKDAFKQYYSDYRYMCYKVLVISVIGLVIVHSATNQKSGMFLELGSAVKEIKALVSLTDTAGSSRRAKK